MKNMIMSFLTVAAISGFAAEPFVIEKNDIHQIRIHGSPDETKATYAMMRELAAEVKRVTGVEVEIRGYAPAEEGDFYVSTQPWAAKGAYTYGTRNGVVGIHGSDVKATEAALRDFIDKHVKTVPTSAGRFDFSNLRVNHGKQWADVREATVAAVAKQRTKENAPEWENELVNYVNVEPARNYSFPLASVEAALTEELPTTPYVKSLNGKWRYNWCGAPSLRPVDFYKTDYNDSDWYTIDVPSCVELKGYGVPGYTNIRYPHPPKPPYTDRDYNPVSSYRTTFTVPAEWKGRDIHLRFEGVYSAYYVWVNGKKVGYSEDSCTAHEFNITPYLNSQPSTLNSQPSTLNTLAVEVYRWSDGAYLEDQDYFRYSGIYRNVMIFATPKAGIRDFHAAVDLVNGYRDATIALEVETVESDSKRTTASSVGGDPRVPRNISAALYDASFKKVADLVSGASAKGKQNFSLTLKNAHLWSAEDPYLYTLVIKAGDDIRACKLGMRKVESSGFGAVLYNGRKIKFKGVNRHDASPENGRSVTRAEMERDVLLMKRYNIDTIRTSHYPNDPYLYYLCDRYGIYVQAEANVESHGMGYGVKCLASPPSWVDAHVARCRDMVINLRNHPCLFSWSWGNEAGQGPAFDEINKVCRPLETMLPMTYRQDCERMPWDGPGYPALDYLIQRSRARKTQFLYEYAHCMGNALGTFTEYWDVIYSSDSLIGGCIWDWTDQAVWKYTDRLGRDGKRVRYLAYGGDHDELNDGNFCCNGIIDAERNVTPKLLEVAHVQRNLVTSGGRDGLEIWNRFCFTNADRFDGRWTLLANGEPIASGAFAVPSVAPLSRKKLSLKDVIGESCGQLTTASPVGGDPRAPRNSEPELFLNVEYATKTATWWAPKGWVIARDQIALNDSKRTTASKGEDALATKDAETNNRNAIAVTESPSSITVLAGDTRAVFSRASGTISQLIMNGRIIIRDRDGVVRGPRLTCMRALTDNDIWMRGSGDEPLRLGCGNLYQSGLTQLRYHVRELKPIVGGVRAVVSVDGAKSAGFLHTADYLFETNGSFRVESDVKPFGRMPPALPRLGLTMAIEHGLENFTWYGRGPGENYIDRCGSTFLGLWRSTVKDQYVNYIRPQDNGYKCDVRWAQLTDRSGLGVRFAGSEPLFVQALHYTWEDLEFARHRDKQQRFWNVKPPRSETWLNLDVRQTGLGGASCGPKPEKKYIFAIEPLRWTTWFMVPER